MRPFIRTRINHPLRISDLLPPIQNWRAAENSIQRSLQRSITEQGKEINYGTL